MWNVAGFSIGTARVVYWRGGGHVVRDRGKQAAILRQDEDAGVRRTVSPLRWR